MKEFLFISDFDGTLTSQDFYQIVIEKYLGEEGQKLCEKWKKGDLTLFEFLDTVFSSIHRSEAEILETIFAIPIDAYAKTFIEHVKASGMDFLILSAGTGYYIGKLFEHLGVSDVPIISNQGIYIDGGIRMIRDRENPFYTETTGIDKLIAIRKFKTEYRKVFYAGDSQPDLKAAMSADIAFAKPGLQKLLNEKGHPFVPFNSLTEIEEYLMKQGYISVQSML